MASSIELIPGMALTAAEKAKARKAAEKFVDAAKHWVPLEEKAADARGAMTKELLGLAQYAWQTHKRNPKKAEELYAALTGEGEVHIKTTLQVSNLKKELASWAPIKSVILRGMRLGLPPVEYETYTQFRGATLQLVEQKSRRKALPRTISQLDIDDIEEQLGSTGVLNILKSETARVVAVMAQIDSGHTREAQALTREYLERLAPLMKPQK